MSEEKATTRMVHKVVLSTKKIVHLSEMKIKHQNLAAKLVGKRGDDNTLLMSTMMQQELLKMLIVDVNGKRPDPAQLEDLDSIFTYAEFQQLMKVMGKLMGGDEGEPTTEIANIGKP